MYDERLRARVERSRREFGPEDLGHPPIDRVERVWILDPLATVEEPGQLVVLVVVRIGKVLVLHYVEVFHAI